ncbi:CD151 antigen-like [Stegodyphus dumicola]|uniref:CD151 antigen-like n=1 Tax=Stegodyphus dumicola TaxID=202533 RepID=UPI0015B261EA|nr:CD151 antigen-like [Stegodyphus dumicola]
MDDANVLLGPDVYYASNVMLIICGIIIVVFSFLSCFDTFFKKRITLCILTYCLCITFVTQSVIAALSFTWMNEIDYFLDSRLNHFIQEGYHPNLRGTSAFTALDKIQERFQCCGARNYTDWRTSKWLIETNDSSAIPLSCCKIAVSITNCNLKNLRNIFTKGCSEPLTEKYKTNFLTMGIVSILISLFQLLCFHVSNYLMFRLE